MQFAKVLDRIEEVNDTIPHVIEQAERLDIIIERLLTDNAINDEEASELSKYVASIRKAMDSINGK